MFESKSCYIQIAIKDPKIKNIKFMFNTIPKNKKEFIKQWKNIKCI